MLRCPSRASAQQSVFTGYTLHFVFSPSLQELAHCCFISFLNSSRLLVHHTAGAAFRYGILQPLLKNNQRNEALDHSMNFGELFSLMIGEITVKEVEV